MSTPEISEELKDELERALLSGRREEAVELLQTRAQLSPKAAKAMVWVLSIALRKKRLEASDSDTAGTVFERSSASPPAIGDTPQGAVKTTAGCGSAVFLALAAPLLWILFGL